MTQSLEGWPTKAKEAPSLHEVRLALLDTNPVLQCLQGKRLKKFYKTREMSFKWILSLTVLARAVLEPSQNSVVELFWKKSPGLLAVSCFCKKAPQ